MIRLPRVFFAALMLACAALMFTPLLALAQEPAEQGDTPVLTGLPVGIIVVSFVMTAVGYVLNYLLPFLTTDKAKGIAHAVYQAAGVILFELATGSGFGFNEATLTAFITAIATWGVSHGLLFKPTGWSAALGAGRNATG